MNSADRESRHLSVHVDRTADEVYAYASDPVNLPAWAHGLGGSIEKIDGRWVAGSSPMGRVVVTFVPRNDLGVLDHDVTLPSGETVDRDADTVAGDLNRLRELMEPA
ncbi:SRPBCC family protein [Streptomyces sp. NPDC058257]|uniref:SRPBCC family protein n=1 Tax=Streptomyces sp. NPDC058257 TaxID=3346409 RepID=UPI0036F14DFB